MDNEHFFVHVVESPSSTDLLDGRTEGRVLLEALNLSQVPATYSLVTSRATLDLALGERLRQAIAYWKRFPLLHFSLHGDTNGIALTDNHFISWQDFRSLLLPINQQVQGALIVCLSTCFGAAGCRMAMYEKQPIPFFALVGHLESAPWRDAAVSFITLYHHLRKGTALPRAVDAMKVAAGDDRFAVFLGHEVQQNYEQFVSQKRLQDLLAAMMGKGGGMPIAAPGPSNSES